MVKVIKIIKDDAITGVQYGTVDVPQTPTKIERAQQTFERIKNTQIKKSRNERTKNK